MMPRSRPSAVDVPATLAGAIAAIVLAILIYVGSGGLAAFDAALIGYATATIFLAFGVVYRYVVWIQSPPAKRYLRRGWGSFLSFRNFTRFPTLVPKALVSNLALQTFIARRGKARWVAHQALFWGVVVATLVTFPLTFGWIRFEALPGEPARYVTEIVGIRTFTFDPLGWVGWLTFHILDVSAVLVLAGCSAFLWRRVRDRGAGTGQRLGYDFLPLVALVAISATGLLMTFSSMFLGGRSYDFLAIVHMSAVVLTLVFIPFGKFFHVIQRPASLGVETFKVTALASEGPAACTRCGEPLEAVGFVRDLEGTMDELELGFSAWVRTCPRCKRILRGRSYLDHVKRGFE